jgi:hypothetical protein
MSILFRSRAGVGADGAPHHPHQVWRTSAGRPPRADAATRIWAVIAALLVVGLLTAGLHILFH